MIDRTKGSTPYGFLVGKTCAHPDGCTNPDPRIFNSDLGPACSRHYQRIKKYGEWGVVGYVRIGKNRASEGVKRCITCDTIKPVSDFSRSKHAGDGFVAHCRSCKNDSLRVKVCSECSGPSIGTFCSTPCRYSHERSNGTVSRKIDKKGYVILRGYVNHPNCRGKPGKTNWGIIFEHVLVMSEHVGRPLVKGENVHHKNGKRDDNRIENLELWSKSQPPGQRVVDKILWAKELLALYEPTALCGGDTE